MLALSALFLIVTLQDAFESFAACEGREAQAALAKRLAFHAGMRDETDIRNLPEHVARNEQEAVLALQQTLLPPGTSVRLVALTRRTALNDCEGTVILCLRDGSFRCIIELNTCSWAKTQIARAHVFNLRPLPGCSTATPTDPCQQKSLVGGSLELKKSLTEEAVGRWIARSQQVHDQWAKEGSLPAQLDRPSLGHTAFPDLSYSALAYILAVLRELSCAALRRGDLPGAALAIGKAFHLEGSCRLAEFDEHEVPLNIRSVLADLYTVRAALKRVQGDYEGAHAELLSSARMNISSDVSSRKLSQAMSRVQLNAPRDVAGLGADEAVQLQEWFAASLPLDVEEHGSLRRRHKLSEPTGAEQADATTGGLVSTSWTGAMESSGVAESTPPMKS